MSVDSLMLIGGQLIAASADGWLESVNPANEEVVGRAPAGTAVDVDKAVDAAALAQPSWNALSVWARAGLLRKLAQGIRERGPQILRLEASDTGNTIGKLTADVQIAAGYLEYFAGLGSEMKGETVPATAGNLHFTLREPYGVVGRIVPFNHPFMFAAAHLAAPLMAGNTVVLKTPEQSPLSGGILAQLCQEHLPAGVVNIVSGNGLPVGDALVRHPLVRRIGFTGSVPTGLAIQRSAAEVGVKHVTLELGGKNPFIVFPDADIDAVVEAAIAGMNFSWAGQSCGSTSRLLLHESVYDEVFERVVERVAALKLGDPLDPTSEMGPVNSKRHYDRVCAYINAAKADGAQLATGGERPTGDLFRKGYWIEPTVFGRVAPDMAVAREEIFGPVLTAIRWKTEAQVLQIANSTEYGLTAAIWTRDLKTALRTARAVQSGVVWINGAASHYVGVPFGGMKNSGLGHEESLGELLSYTQTKAVHVMLT